MREAIRLNDHIRIRNGSPGALSAGRTAEKHRTIDSSHKTKNFDEEMQEKGIASEIEDLNRFNYVLATRSSPAEEKFI